MNERRYNPSDHPWDDGIYGIGRTKPPKSRGGIVAVLLILVIFLSGIVTILGIMNVKLFQELNQQEEQADSISFSPEETEASDPSEITGQTEALDATEPEDMLSIHWNESPDSVDNVPDPEGMALQDIYERSIDSVVSISCALPGGSSTGTGVIISTDGYIVTNCHVVEDAVNISVSLTDEREFPAMLVGADEISDLAVLYIEATDLQAVEFGDSDALRVGDTVVAIGDPLGVKFRGSMTDGIVSAINRDVTIDGRTLTLIQTNAALNSGNSGGPLINCFGQVIGINTMKISTFVDNAGVEGLGFAIPSSTVKDIVEQLIRQGYVSGRPTLGITGESISSLYQIYYRIPQGLYIEEVDSGSDAAAKGIEPGDILISIDDQRITDMDDLNAFLYSHEVGDQVQVIIYRASQQYRVELTLTEDKG